MIHILTARFSTTIGHISQLGIKNTSSLYFYTKKSNSCELRLLDITRHWNWFLLRLRFHLQRKFSTAHLKKLNKSRKILERFPFYNLNTLCLNQQDLLLFSDMHLLIGSSFLNGHPEYDYWLPGHKTGWKISECLATTAWGIQSIHSIIIHVTF